MKIVWVYVDASRQRPWCALVGAYPAGRIVTGCSEFPYREIMTSTHEPNDLCCMECLRRVEAGLREPAVPLAIDKRPTADLRGPQALDVEAEGDWR